VEGTTKESTGAKRASCRAGEHAGMKAKHVTSLGGGPWSYVSSSMAVTAVPPASETLMKSALDIARGAGDITLEWFKSSKLTVETKDDGSPVTQADKAAERYIRERIEEVAPGSRLVGEEEGESEGSADAELTWYIDPIDGTKGFSRGVPLYATLLAVEDEHGYAVGVIHIPATGETVWAGRGLGAHTDAGPARVSDVGNIDGAFVTTSDVSRWECAVFSRMQDAGVNVRGWGDGYGWLMVATGRIDAMIDLGAGTPWDFGPLPVIIPEAGGRFTDLDGNVSIHSKSVVASNGRFHDDLLRVLRG
jgi:histidinol-phosphatase